MAMRCILVTAILGFTTLSQTALAGPGGSTASILTLADFNQDGITDILAQKLRGPDKGLLWITLVDSASGDALGSEFPIRLQDGYEFMAAGNFNGNLEGQSQIAARKVSGTPVEEIGMVRLWDLSDNASTTTTPAEGVLTIAPDPMYRLIGVGDLDGNGVDDFVFVQDSTGPNPAPNPGLIRVYLMNTAMELEQIAHPLNVSAFSDNLGNPLEIFGVADADGDGIADIVLANRANRNLRVFLMQHDAQDGIRVSAQRFAFRLPQSNYDFMGFALVDPGRRADLIFKNGNSAGAHEGLLQVRRMLADATGIAPPFYPSNLGTSFDFVGNGLFDGDTAIDLVIQRNGGANNGRIQLLLLDITQADQVKNSTFPAYLEPADWEERSTRAVVFP